MNGNVMIDTISLIETEYPIIKNHSRYCALNIKAHNVYNINDAHEEERDAMYECAERTFFRAAELIAKSFGFAGIGVIGRSGGWLTLTTTDGYKYDQVKYPNSLEFRDRVLLESVNSCFSLIKKTMDDIVNIYRNARYYFDIKQELSAYMDEVI